MAPQPAFVLHRRPYRESSLLLEVFSALHGRAGLVAKGVFRKSREAGAALQPFRPLLLEWAGRGELGTLTAYEVEGPLLLSDGATLLCGFYLNELLLRLLPRQDAHPELFGIYRDTLRSLGNCGKPEAHLRLFEMHLLAALGYGLTLDRDAVTGERIHSEETYTYRRERGPSRHWPDREASENPVQGRSLLALAAGGIDEPEVLKDLKRLMRFLLQPHLGPRPLATRAWFSETGKLAGEDGNDA